MTVATFTIIKHPMAGRTGWNKSFFDHMREQAAKVDAAVTLASPATTPSFEVPDHRPEVVRRARELPRPVGDARAEEVGLALFILLPEDPTTLDRIGLIRIANACRDMERVWRMANNRANEDAARDVADLAMIASKMIR